MSLLFRILVLVTAFTTTALHAGERLALVIGNAAYSTVSSLDNPANDARLMSRSLVAQGFKVTMLIDATQLEMQRGIAQFGRDLRNAGTDATGLFYYAGHGVQSFGSNFLLPVDVALNDAADLDLVAVDAQSVLRQMFSARNRTNIVILDACRDNPFSEIPDFYDTGLAEMQAPTGTFLAYATAPGDVALDGLDGNSPFTRAVAAQMSTPGLPIEQMFKHVRVAVLEKTNGRQTPWDASSLTSDFTFAPATVLSGAELEAQQLWGAVRASRDPVQILLFLRGFADSSLAGEARALLVEVMAQELAGVALAQAAPQAPPVPVPVPQGPSEAERAMFEAARAEPGIASYEAYLQSYPEGVFAEFAAQELAALLKNAATDPADSGALAKAQAGLAPTVPAPVDSVFFTQALLSETPEVSGRSIADLVKSTPMFPPVEGLPEEYWKGQTCSSCHQWTQASICEQANTYLTLNMQRSLSKPHPFGGALKQNLKTWAAGGCK